MPQSVSHELFAAQGLATNEIVSGLFLTDERHGADRRFASMMGIRVIVCCNASPHVPQYAEYNEGNGETIALASHEALLDRIRLLGPRPPDTDPRTLIMNIAADDSPTFDLSPWFPRAGEVLEATRLVGAKALVHCLAGISRSATVVAAHLMQRTELTPIQVLGYMRERRSCVNPNPGFINQLHRWEMIGYTSFGRTQDDDAIIQRFVANFARKGNLQRFRAYISNLLHSVHQSHDRSLFGRFLLGLHRERFLTLRELVHHVLDVALTAFKSDDAMDNPRLVHHLLTMLAAINASINEEECDDVPISVGRITSADLTALFSALVCGMGDPFGFDFDSTVRFVSAAGSVDKHETLPLFPWVHVFAARLRVILDTGSPLAFPPPLLPPFTLYDAGGGTESGWELTVTGTVRLEVLRWCCGAFIDAVKRSGGASAARLDVAQNRHLKDIIDLQSTVEDLLRNNSATEASLALTSDVSCEALWAMGLHYPCCVRLPSTADREALRATTTAVLDIFR